MKTVVSSDRLNQTLYLVFLAVKQCRCMTQGLFVQQEVATLWCSKRDYRRTLCVDVVVFRVVWLVNVAMAAARVPQSRAAEQIESRLLDLLCPFYQQKWARVTN